MYFNTLDQVRQQMYGCFERGRDALFNLSDALLSEPQARSLPELSLSAFFERRWPSVYEALQDGRINVERLRTVFVQALLADKAPDEPLWLGLDSSGMQRLEAASSRDRGMIYVPNMPHATKPVSVGWQFSTLMLLPEQPSSWVGILAQQRIRTEQTAVEVAIMQLRAVLPLLKRPVVIVADRWYATPEFLEACRDLGCRVIVRLKRNRKLYRPPVRKHTRGAPPKDGPLFQGTRPETLGTPDEEWEGEYHGKPVRLSRWNHLHFSQARELSVSVVRVQREHATNTKRDPRESWFVLLDDRLPLSQVVGIYARRFSQEHGYRFLKHHLLWDKAQVRTPEQYERWSVLVALAHNHLLLAHDLGHAAFRPWERPSAHALTPQQVRRGMSGILSQVGTPARVCKPRGKSSGRAQGFHPQPAQRYDVVRKHPKKEASASG
ncbi:MAG: hypothetical protein NVSMB38_32910 [Ktedonobacteraceae bacterium]